MERPEFTVDEAKALAAKNADSYRDVASVSRTLLAYIEVLEAKIEELTNGCR